MIVVGHVLGFAGPRAETFEIFIQLGAILAVVGVFWSRFTSLIKLQKSEGQGADFSGKRGLLLLLATSLPGLVLGKLAHHAIKEHLFTPATVAMGLLVGAILMLLVEKFKRKSATLSVESITWKQALGIGCFQCLALWPGMSRSSSTIVGGMALGLSREAAAEYSFLAAVPIIGAATCYDLYKSRSLLEAADIGYFTVGFLVSWLVAWVSIRFLLRYLTRHSLSLFAWYRIFVAVVVFYFLH